MAVRMHRMLITWHWIQYRVSAAQVKVKLGAKTETDAPTRTYTDLHDVSVARQPWATRTYVKAVCSRLHRASVPPHRGGVSGYNPIHTDRPPPVYVYSIPYGCNRIYTANIQYTIGLEPYASPKYYKDENTWGAVNMAYLPCGSVRIPLRSLTVRLPARYIRVAYGRKYGYSTHP
ncbi:hypothetical protein B0H14DRAFT_2576459 [Mycena olivaceomarginata]|nr:hypothetical protein B0H14DRAFT_2576459 [Mycena olivaceomarginata]